MHKLLGNTLNLLNTNAVYIRKVCDDDSDTNDVYIRNLCDHLDTNDVYIRKHVY